MPSVDVIIPAYNSGRFLSEAIESVIAQTHTDWRILMVDDGSTDDTAAIAEGFAKKLGPRFTYMSQKNGGPSAARNRAIQHGSADFIAFLDADDVWLPDRLTRSLASFASRPQTGLSYGLISWIDPEGNVLGTFVGNPKHSQGRIAPSIYMREVELPCATIMLRRSCVADVGLFDESMRQTEDRDLWLRIAQRFEVAFVPEVLALYRVSADSLSADPEQMMKSQLRFIQKHYGSPGCGWKARQRAVARIYKQRADALKASGKGALAVQSALRAFAQYPFDRSNLATAASLLLSQLGFRRERA